MSFNFDRRTFLKGAGAVGAASLLAACGEKSNNTGNGAAASGAAAPNSTGATPLKEFISFESGNRELESWNMLYTQKAEDANVVTNLWDGLLSFDRYGKVVPAIASSWEHNEDATVWTFHLRDDVDWVDCNGEVKAHLTSKDFLVGFEWVMNAIKNEANNTSMPNDTIVGAYEYYELTKEAGDAAADMTYEDMLAAGVGIEAPDDYTLVFTCPSACPYFDTVAAYNSFYPAAEDLINELGIEGANVLAIAAATFGLVSGSLMGGPTARSIINRYGLTSTESEDEIMEIDDENVEEKAKAERRHAEEARAEQARAAHLRNGRQPKAATASLAPSGLPIH